MMARSEPFYIPRRVYELLKCIYKERITVISAPDGYGKSGTTKEFVRRSRKEGFSCRFVTDAENANDCFNRVSSMILGHEEPIPTTASDFNRIQRLFSLARQDKELVIILDCAGGTDMLLGNLYCTWLFLRHSPAHIVLVTPELSYFHKMLADSSFITSITEKELALNVNEIGEMFDLFRVSCSDPAEMRRRTNGEIVKLRLCILLMQQGIEISSYDLCDLMRSAIVDRLDREQLFAAMCAAAINSIDTVTLNMLRAEPALCSYFGENAITEHNIFSSIRYIASAIPMIRLNERTHSWTAHTSFKRAVYQHFNELPEDIRSAIHRCSAKEQLRNKRNFHAFCQFYLSGDVSAAAKPVHDVTLSFDLLMKSKDFLLDFAEKCPLDCKPIIPRLLRVLSLLMLTPYRDRISYRFDDVIEYVSRSKKYSAAERRNTLCYANVLRTYEDFYLIEKMGNHIKRAYDLFTGVSIGIPPFYTWSLYAPSIFCLIHHYHLPIRTEAEQFARYHSMYTEMIHHGEHILSLYNAEIYYFIGDPENALPRAQEVVAGCSKDILLPTRIAALNTVGKSALMLGEYEIFTECTQQLADITRKYSSTEIAEMAALCIALLCCLRNGTDEDIWSVTSTRDDEVLLNRYTAPFYFKTRCYAMLSHHEYRMLLNKRDYYLQACEDVRSETIALSIKLSAAIAHLELGESTQAISIIIDVLETMDSSDVIMPAIEQCMLYPLLFELALEELPRKYQTLLQRILNQSTQYRRNMIAIRTQELTELNKQRSETDIISAALNTSLAALEPYRKEYELSEQALTYALYAARRFTNEQIAEICHTSVNSVKSSLKRTYAKLGIRSRGQLKYIFKIRE